MAASDALNLKPLREQVYTYLKRAITSGEIQPGAFLDLAKISGELGISKTPLRDSLIQLEAEGFVSILARRGVLVNPLTLDEIRHLYEIIGALEGVAVVEVFDQVKAPHLRTMKALNGRMVKAVRAGDFDTYYELNLAFHNVFLDLSDNQRLVGTVRTFKQRLYDFPRRESFVKEWEIASTREHGAFVRLLEKRDARAAADYMRDVHWSFAVQERFVRQYYLASRNPADAGGDAASGSRRGPSARGRDAARGGGGAGRGQPGSRAEDRGGDTTRRARVVRRGGR